MNNEAINSRAVVAFLVDQFECERARRVLTGSALAVLRTSISAKSWRAFSQAVKGVHSQHIAAEFGVSVRQVDHLLCMAWAALRTLEECGDQAMRASALAVRQSCARVPEFRRVIDPDELREVGERGMWSALKGVAEHVVSARVSSFEGGRQK